MPTLDLQHSIDDSDDFVDDDYGDDHDDDSGDVLPPTTRNADHHTIVDMNLRVVRFVVVVAIALLVAFGYALFTSRAHVIEHVRNAAQVESRVAFYNVLLGTIMFATSKIFEIYTETLIFPTIHTYLHNCSLYPGDAPQRTTSQVKTKAIFWGLKTVVILMNVGTASLFVSQRTRGATAAVALSVETHARRLEQLDRVNPVAFFRHDMPQCGTTTSHWTLTDVDYTSVSSAVIRQPWSAHVEASMRNATDVTEPVVVRLQDCVKGVTASCEEVLVAHGVDVNAITELLARATDGADDTTTTTTTLRDGATRAMAFLRASASTDARFSDTTLSVTRVRSPSGMTSLTATLTVDRVVSTESIACGTHQCVLSVPASPQQQISIHVTPHKMVTTATTRSARVAPDRSVREVRTFAFARHVLPSAAPLRLTIDDDDDSALVVPTLPSSSPTQRPTPLLTLHAIVLPEPTGLTTWLPLDHAAGAMPIASASCDPLVDDFVVQFQREAAGFAVARIPSTMTTTALLYLTQHATPVPSSAAQALARRLETTTTTGTTTTNVKLTLSISVYSAAATFTGVGIMVVLMVFVIVRPQARVRLTPNTTPAAQYVQILTDDLYPNIVHKKRLRFVNGEVLPFNEYVVDSIVLHAKRDTTKKIYL